MPRLQRGLLLPLVFPVAALLTLRVLLSPSWQVS